MNKTKLKLFLIIISLISVVCIFAFITSGNEAEPILAIEGCNLSFMDSVHIKYAVSSENADDIKLLIWTSPTDNFTKGTENSVLSAEPYKETVSGQECKIFIYKDIAAKQMADNIYARAYVVKDGHEYYSSVKKYSILQYAYNKLGKTGEATENEDLKKLLINMLDYGAEAQKYFNYNTDRLANDNFYQIEVESGYLSDKTSSGLYLADEKVILKASDKNEKGNPFSHWETVNGEFVAWTPEIEITVNNQNDTYIAVYDDLEYTVTENGTCSVFGIGTYKGKILAIPGNSPSGETITEIGSSAFINNTDFTEVIISENVETIQAYAFNNCDSLRKISIPSSVTTIAKKAFYDCGALEEITIPKTVLYIKQDAFTGCNKLSIKCEIAENDKPSGWASTWNRSNRPVTWDCNNITVNNE